MPCVDLLSVQELTPNFSRSLHRAGIDRRLPEAVEETHKGAAGGGIYSRFPIDPIATGSPSFFRQPRVEVRLPDGRRLRVVDIHPLTPGRTGIDVWEDSLGDLPATGEGVPWVWIGDFNATLDHSRLCEVLDRGYRDAGDVAGMGLLPTWPNRDHTLPPFITIDTSSPTSASGSSTTVSKTYPAPTTARFTLSWRCLETTVKKVIGSSAPSRARTDHLRVIWTGFTDISKAFRPRATTVTRL